ncbi:MAG: hypothetical protein NC403_08835 [Muribaculaceae bacterium]|nr:hypothetical protein [Muribaculaceae bacterium]
MKKPILLLGIMLCAFSAKAQIIAGLDEVALMGNWSAYEYVDNSDNIWPSMQNNRLSAISFADDGITSITVQSNNFSDFRLINFYGYIISGTATGKYTLHFIQQADSETWDYETPQLNFVIKSFDGDKLALTSYDGKHGMVLQKVNSGVSEVSADTPEAYGIYNSSGIKIENPTAPGLYIRGNGGKFIKK